MTVHVLGLFALASSCLCSYSYVEEVVVDDGDRRRRGSTESPVGACVCALFHVNEQSSTHLQQCSDPVRRRRRDAMQAKPVNFVSGRCSAVCSGCGRGVLSLEQANER